MTSLFCVLMGLSTACPDTAYGEYLLTTPLHVAPLTPTDPLVWQQTQQACRGYCTTQGIVSPYWLTSLFATQEHYVRDVKWAKERLTELKSCPPETDTRLFLHMKPFISINIALNRHFHYYLSERIEDPWETPHNKDLLRVIREANTRHYEAWDYLRDVFNATTLYHRRAGLNNLQLVLGQQAYEAGRMLESVPGWAFQELDK